VRFKPGPDNDTVKARAEIPLSEFTAAPTETGLVLELLDERVGLVFGAAIDAAEFQDVSGSSTRYLFRDRDGVVPGANGIRQIKIIEVPAKSIAKIKISVKGTEVPAAADQDDLSLSLLFGTDPAFDDCLTAVYVPCKSNPKKTSCKDE